MQARPTCPGSALARARAALPRWRPLLGSAGCLLTAELVASLIGFLFWGLAARLYAPGQVGLASAVLAAVTLVSSIAGLGTSNGLVRFLPRACQPSRLLNTILTMNVTCAVVVGAVYLAGARVWSPSLAFLYHDTRLAAAFIAYAALSALGTVTKMAFVSGHRAGYALSYTCTVNFCRLLLLLLLRPWEGMGVVASVAIACALATTFSLWRDLPRVIADYRPCLLLDVAHVRSVVPYSLASYLAGLLASSQRTILPLVVLEMLGREANAHAYAAMMIGSLLASPAAALATAAFAESAHAPRHVSVIMWPAAILGVGLSIPAAGLLAVAAPQVLALFGTTYAREAVGLTRWLALAAPLNALKELYLARLRVEARMGELIACNAISSSLIVVLSAALLPQLGLSGIGLASLFAQGSLACLGARDVLVGARRSSAKTQVAGPGKRSLKIALVCSHGGHLTEMEMLAPAFEGHRCFLVTYRSVRTQGLPGTCYLLHNIGSSPWRLLCAFAHAVRILWRERPDVIVSTGSEIAIPFLWLGRLVGMRTAYVETWCRMTGPSRTGKLVYPASDLFLVQWPALLEHYGPRARYEGGLM